MEEVFVRSGFPFNYDQDRASQLSGLKCEDKSRTLQSQAQDADINVIVKRFGVTGQLPQVGSLPTFRDFEGIFDYRSALDAVREADRMFMEVPADIRGRFQNDPQRFVEFCSDPKNLDELRKMGLAPPAPVEVRDEPKAKVESDKKRAKSSEDDSAAS